MYKVWQNPYTLRFWVVDDNGRGFPGPCGGPHLTEKEASEKLAYANGGKSDSEKEITIGAIERNSGNDKHIRHQDQKR